MPFEEKKNKGFYKDNSKEPNIFYGSYKLFLLENLFKYKKHHFGFGWYHLNDIEKFSKVFFNEFYFFMPLFSSFFFDKIKTFSFFKTKNSFNFSFFFDNFTFEDVIFRENFDRFFFLIFYGLFWLLTLFLWSYSMYYYIMFLFFLTMILIILFLRLMEWCKSIMLKR